MGRSLRNPENVESGRRTSQDLRTPFVDKTVKCSGLEQEKNADSRRLQTSDEGVD